MKKTNWLGLWKKRQGVYSGYVIDKKEIPDKTCPILRYNKFYEAGTNRPQFVLCFADVEAHDRMTTTVAFDEWEESLEDVVRIEDAVHIACGLLRSMEYGHSIDDLVVWASDYMKEASVRAAIVDEDEYGLPFDFD